MLPGQEEFHIEMRSLVVQMTCKPRLGRPIQSFMCNLAMKDRIDRDEESFTKILI